MMVESSNVKPASTLTDSDRLSCAKMAEANPVWIGHTTGKAAFAMPSNLLLHAGPPFRSLEEIPAPILNSALVAAVYEGLSDDFDTAENMIKNGDVKLDAAQNYAVVTPLAAVVSASMPLHSVKNIPEDLPLNTDQKSQIAYAPINGGAAPSLRLGLKSLDVLEHIRWLNDGFADYLERGLRQVVLDSGSSGIALLPLAVEGLQHGDDCHGRTPVANQKLFERLGPRVGVDADRINQFVQSSPSIFLNLWMAATKCILTSAEGVSGSSLLTAAGANGVQTGIQISGFPGKWFVESAEAPLGNIEADLSADRVCAALGDSSIIEGFGLGAMAIKHSPDQLANFQAVLPENLEARLSSLLAHEHPGFASINHSVGCCVNSVVAADLTPIVALGMIDRLGLRGRIGGGIYQMPLSVFKQAYKALA